MEQVLTPPRFSVARAGQDGYHHRTSIGHKVMRIGNGLDPKSGSTEFDISERPITPYGGFARYPDIRNDFVMIRGACVGPKKRVVVLRKSLREPTSRKELEQITLKFIDTASHGRKGFQTRQEKEAFEGVKKIKTVA